MSDIVGEGFMAPLEGAARNALNSRGFFVEVEDSLMDEVGDRWIDFFALFQETPGDGWDFKHAVGQENGRRFAFPGIVFPIVDPLVIINRWRNPGKRMFIEGFPVTELETYDRFCFILPNEQIKKGIPKLSFYELSLTNSRLVPFRYHNPSVFDVDIVP